MTLNLRVIPLGSGFLITLFPCMFMHCSQSARETKAASHVLQTVWSYKELRNTLTKDGWNKTHFQVERSKDTHKHSDFSLILIPNNKVLYKSVNLMKKCPVHISLQNLKKKTWMSGMSVIYFFFFLVKILNIKIL